MEKNPSFGSDFCLFGPNLGSIIIVTSMNSSVLKLRFQINSETSYHFIDHLANLVMNLIILSTIT